MTREIIGQIERDYWAEKADPIDMTEIFDLARKALEQEPVLDKIRAEIGRAWCTKPKNRYEEGLKDQALKDLKIIDKYKGESEG